MNLDWIEWILTLMFLGLVSMPYWVIVIEIVWGDPCGSFVDYDCSSDPTSVDTRNFVSISDRSPDGDDDGDDVELDCELDWIECLDIFDMF